MHRPHSVTTSVSPPTAPHAPTRRLHGRPPGTLATTAVLVVALLVVWAGLTTLAWNGMRRAAARDPQQGVRGGLIRLAASPPPTWWHRFKPAVFSPPFDIALPDPQHDHNTRVIMNDWYEDVLGDVFRVLLAGRCEPNVTVVDFGANLGVFSAASAAWGCSVVAVEAQSRLMPYLAQTMRANGWQARPGAARDRPTVTLRNVAVFDEPGVLRIAYYTPLTNASGWLSMSMDAESLAACPTTPGCAVEEVPVLLGADLVPTGTLFVKIDVDGPEARVVRSLFPALDRERPEGIMVEICPPNWGSHIARAEGMRVVARLLDDYAYEVVLLDQIDFSTYKPGFLDRCGRIEGVFKPVAYAMPRPLLDELFEDATTPINCKNVLFVRSVRAIVDRFAAAGGVLLPPASPVVP